MASKKRKHPLVPLALWLGVSLAASLMVLAIRAMRLDRPIDFDKVFNEGMVAGAGLCTGAKEVQ